MTTSDSQLSDSTEPLSHSSDTIPRSYQQLPSRDHDDVFILTESSRMAARRTLLNFALMSILFSANHGCVVGMSSFHNY